MNPNDFLLMGGFFATIFVGLGGFLIFVLRHMKHEETMARIKAEAGQQVEQAENIVAE